MRKRTSDYSSDTEPRLANGCAEEDVTILKRSEPSFTGFLEAKNIFDGGGDEVRRLLLQECNLIFECNVCRNMFRDLPNFISHKRFYCCSTLAAVAAGAPASPIHAISAVVPYPPASTPCQGLAVAAGNALGVENFRAAAEALSGQVDDINPTMPPWVGEPNNQALIDAEVEAMRPNFTVNNLLEAAAFNGITEEAATQDKALPASSLCNTENDQGSETTMQNITGGQEELAEGIEDATNNDPVGEPIDPDKEPITTTVPVTKKPQCSMCDLEFQTGKALKIHIHRKHLSVPSSSAYSFKCPSCALTFMQPAAVIRHLANDHKKSVRRIRVKRRPTTDEEVSGKGAANRELRLLQSSEGYGKGGTIVDPSPNTELTEKKKVMSSCIYCEKSFERRAALSTHLMSCRVKLEALEKPPPMKRPRIQSNGSLSEHNNNNSTGDGSVNSSLNGCNDISPAQDSNHAERLIIKTESVDTDALNEMFAKLSQQTFEGLKTVSLNAIVSCSAASEEDYGQPVAAANEVQQADDDKAVRVPKQELEVETKDNRLRTPEKTVESNGLGASTTTEPAKEVNVVPCRCKICNKHFNALSNLRRHISMFHYRARKFGCTLCDYRAFRRYDIVNHLGFVHKMTEDRETMSLQYVSVHDVPYSKDDMDGDIVLEADSSGGATAPHPSASDEGVSPVRTYEKRSRRNKSSLNGTATNSSPANNSSINATTAGMLPLASADFPIAEAAPTGALDAAAVDSGDTAKASTRQKLKRAASSSSTATETGLSTLRAQQQQQRRPIRNRIKPENKDFVYDLSGLMKEGAASEEGAGAAAAYLPVPATERVEAVRGMKRRSTCHEPPPPPPSISPPAPFVSATVAQQIIGAVRRICLTVVQNGQAASATLPDLPAERPQMRPRLTSTNRTEMQAVAVIETLELEAARRRSTLLDDSFLDKISKRASASEFKIKPCLEPHHSALASLLRKVDTTMQQMQQQQQQLQQQQQVQDQQQVQEQQQELQQRDEEEPPRQLQSELLKQLSQPHMQHLQQQWSSTQLVASQSAPTAACNGGGGGGGIEVPMKVFTGATAGGTYPPPLVPFDSSMRKAAFNGGGGLAGTDIAASADAVACVDDTAAVQPYTASLAAIPPAWSPPPTPRKRITLVQRMAENRAAAAVSTMTVVTSRHRDSLLRSALEN